TYKETESTNTFNDNKTAFLDDVDMNETVENNDKDFIVITKQTSFIAAPS
ncbi:902_t:CDS:1, partial [Entrophospora sp. SA101]